MGLEELLLYVRVLLLQQQLLQGVLRRVQHANAVGGSGAPHVTEAPGADHFPVGNNTIH